MSNKSIAAVSSKPRSGCRRYYACAVNHCSLGIRPITEAGSPAAQRPLSSYDSQVRALLAQMTLEEKLGQMTQAEQDALKDVNDIQKFFLGSLLSGGSSDPKAGNSLAAWTDMCDGYQEHALKTRLAIPILYGADAVHGHNNVLGAVVFPHNIGLGCTRNPQLVESAGRITALEVRATGVNWTLLPALLCRATNAGQNLRRIWRSA